MLDALCQGIESWWSVNSTNESKQLSKKGVETIMQWWREYIFDNTDESAWHIMQAANWAGQAICITQTTAPHAFSYKITSLFGLPHGHAVAVCLPEIWQYMVDHLDMCIDSRGQIYLVAIFDEIAHAMGQSSAQNAILCFQSLMNNLDMKKPTSSNKNQSVSYLSNSVNPIRLRNNPVSLDMVSIRHIYQIILA